MEVSVTVISNTDEILKAKEEAVMQVLQTWGNLAEGEAINNITAAGRVDTGNLRNSITHEVMADEEAVYIGTNNEYAVYNEIGTGIYAEGGGGRQTPWSYKDKGEDGAWHTTKGMKPIHFLRDAIQNNQDQYKAIADQILKS